jgi:hypothetical protein
VKDNFSIIAAAAGGFMLSVALSGILRGAPVVSWQEQSTLRPATVADLQLIPRQAENVEYFHTKTQKRG